MSQLRNIYQLADNADEKNEEAEEKPKARSK